MKIVPIMKNKGTPHAYRVEGIGRMNNITATYDQNKRVLTCTKVDSRGAKRKPAKTDMPVIEQAIHTAMARYKSVEFHESSIYFTEMLRFNHDKEERVLPLSLVNKIATYDDLDHGGYAVVKDTDDVIRRIGNFLLNGKQQEGLRDMFPFYCRRADSLAVINDSGFLNFNQIADFIEVYC